MWGGLWGCTPPNRGLGQGCAAARRARGRRRLEGQTSDVTRKQPVRGPAQILSPFSGKGAQVPTPECVAVAMETGGGDWEERVCGILGFPGSGSLFSVLFWGSCVVQSRKVWWAAFFFFNYLLVVFLRIWGWASQSDLPNSHDVQV